MAPLAPGKSTFRLEPTNNVLSDGHSNAESPESSRKIYTISELMKMRNIDLMQPAKVFNTPVVNEILRHDLNQSPIYILCPQTQLDLMKPTDNLPNRLRQFHHQRTRHNTRSYEELNPRMGAFAQKRNSRHSNDVQITRTSSSEIRIRLCIQEDVKLHKAENAWTPSMFAEHKVDQDALEELFRQVRAILNKLTAQNFDVMLNQFKTNVIDSKEKLDGVINLVFNKAVNEPNFSVGYAHLCKHLASCWVEIKNTAKDADFKRTFITKCQHEFEQHVANENAIAVALSPLNDQLKEARQNGDAKKVAEINCQIIEEETNVRRRLVSTVGFIGELYKLEMLTTSIMKWCITTLIDSGTDEKLECVCKLLTTIGEKLERKSAANVDPQKKQYLDLSPYMKQLRQIIERKNGKKVGARIRFMIMDLVELRENNWKPKH